MNEALLRQELIRDEGLRLKPYRCPAGKLTLGVGRNIEDMGITEKEANTLLMNDIARIMDELDAHLPWWGILSDARRRALINMAFNLGVPRLLGFRKMIEALRQDEYDTAADEALDSAWAVQVGSRAHRIAALIREG